MYSDPLRDAGVCSNALFVNSLTVVPSHVPQINTRAFAVGVGPVAEDDVGVVLPTRNVNTSVPERFTNKTNASPTAKSVCDTITLLPVTFVGYNHVYTDNDVVKDIVLAHWR